MLTAIEEWKGVRQLVDELITALEGHCRSLGTAEYDVMATGRKVFVPQAIRALERIRSFQLSHAKTLDDSSKLLVQEILDGYSDTRYLVESQLPRNILELLRPLQVGVSNVTHQLGEPEARGVRLVERALLHLRRTLVADVRNVRAEWAQARLDGGEPRCEKLGAVHLLGHGIYAFKALGAGACTDLILGTALRSDSVDLRISEVAVLTEWKVAASARDVSRVAEEAYRQSKDYAGGVLGGIELQTMRYIIVITDREESPPQDRIEGRVTYRHVCVPVSPEGPSKAAKRLRRKPQRA